MSTLYRTAYHVDMKTTPAWYEQKRPRTGTSRSHSPTDRIGAVGRRGFGDENTIYVRSAVYFSRIFNMAAYKDFSWTDDELDLLLRCSLVYKSNTEL